MEPRTSKVSLSIEGMHCAACAAAIESGLRKLPGVAAVSVSFAAKSARVTYDPTAVDLAALKQAVVDAGYSVAEARGEEEEE